MTGPEQHAATVQESRAKVVRALNLSAPSTDPAYEADELLRQLGINLGHGDVTISYVGAFYVYDGHWTQISHRDLIGNGDTLIEAPQDALARAGSPDA